LDSGGRPGDVRLSAGREKEDFMHTVLVRDALSDTQIALLSTKLDALGGYTLKRATNPSDWAERAASAEVLIVQDESLSAETIGRSANLSLIIQLAPGRGQVDRDAAESRGITTEVVHNAALIGVAEHTLLLMLALAKRLPEVHRRTQQSLYPDAIMPRVTTQTEYEFNWSGVQGMNVLYRRTLGIVGLGFIGQLVAERAKAFGMRVLYFDPQRIPSEDESRLGVQYVARDELLASSDYVTLHTRVTPETEKMIDATALSTMKPTACLINTARGRLVDEEALCNAIAQEQIAGAALDVFWKEPPEKDNPLLDFPNVVLTSHCAGIWSNDAAEFQVDFLMDLLQRAA